MPPPVSELTQFAGGGGANVLPPDELAALPQRPTGFISGIALSRHVNSVLRQATFASAMIGQFTRDYSGGDSVRDDGDINTFEESFRKAIAFIAKRFGFIYAIAGGTANALTIDIDPAFTSLNDLIGAPIIVGLTATNTGAATLQITSIGAPADPIRIGVGALTGGELLATSVVILVYTGAGVFQLVHGGAVGGGGGGGGGTGDVLMSQLRQTVPLYPEVETSTGKLLFTPTTNQVVVEAGQTFIHRGVFRENTSSYSLGARTLNIPSNKTCHIRWRYNSGAPLFSVHDLSDVAYNAGPYPEADPRFDTAFDSALIARAVTDASGNVTLTPLVNKIALTFDYSLSIYPITRKALVGTGAWVAALPYVPLNWSRTPKIMGHISRIGYSLYLTIVPEETKSMFKAADDDGNRNDSTGVGGVGFGGTVAGNPNPPCFSDRYGVQPKGWVDLNYNYAGQVVQFYFDCQFLAENL